MYQSRRGGTRRIQRGGDYISTNFSTIELPSSITYSTLSALTAFAGSSFEQWKYLSPDRISQLIGQIDIQIGADGTEIGRLQGLIDGYNRQINIDPNYKSTFDEASFRYSSTLTQYINVSTSIQQAISSFATDNALLSTYSTVAAGYQSTLNSLRQNYSTLLSSTYLAISLISVEQSTLDSFVSSFRTTSTTCSALNSEYLRQFNTYTRISSFNAGPISIVGTDVVNNNSLLAALSSQMLTATNASRPPLSTISTQRISTFNRLGQINTALSRLNMSVANSFISTVGASTNMIWCPQTLAYLSTSATASRTRLNKYIAISTTFVVGSADYWSTIQYWSTLEQQALSSISAFTYNKQVLLQQRDTLNGEIEGLKTNLRTGLNNLDRSAWTFFSTKRTQLINEALEYKNATAQLSAYLGMLSAEYTMKKLDLSDDYDTLSLQITNAIQTNNLTLKTSLEAQRNAIPPDQTGMDTQIKDLNVLEQKFIELDGKYNEEIALKNTFITKRSTMYMYERNLLWNPASRNSILAEYNALWENPTEGINALMARISETITGVNGEQQRWENDLKPKIETIYTEFTTKYKSKYPAAFNAPPGIDPWTLRNYPFNFNGRVVQDSRDMNKDTYRTNSAYAILPAINPTAPIPNYSLN